MKIVRVSWLLILSLGFLFIHISQAKHGKKLPSAVVTGTVYCDTCFQQDFSRASHFISGASVAVKCGDKNSRESFYKEVKTNEQGVFEVTLPSAVSKHVKRIKGCSVKLLHSSEPFCAVASSATSTSLHLKGRKEGTHVFSAGFFTFKPLKQPDICNQKPTVPSTKTFGPNKDFSESLDLLFPPGTTTPIPTLPTIPVIPTIPTIPTLPTIPVIPTHPTLPTLPTLPTIPGIPPLLPPLPSGVPKLPTSEQQKNVEHTKKSGLLSKKQVSLLPPIVPPVLPSPTPTIGGIPLPPNPLQPAPLLPNPLQPPPATGIPGIPGIPPVLPTPPPAGIPGIPGLPGIPAVPGIPVLPPIPVIMPPPPPPPPTLVPGVPAIPGIPQLPPLPTLPIPPVVPGIPPASSSKKTSP